MTAKGERHGKLEGRIGLVTGGSSGIGLAAAKTFVREGAFVFITGRRESELAAAVKAIGGQVTGGRGDVSNLATSIVSSNRLDQRNGDSTSKTGESRMEQSVEKIIERNMLEVFNGRNAGSCRTAIDEVWHQDGVFIDPGGVHEGVENINATAELLLRSLKATCSRQDNLYKASAAFRGYMGRPMSPRG